MTMSKDIIVLTPNGRRQKVHCTPDTSILQILEDVCQKQGFEPVGYGLKHHNHILDLTNTVRFSNLPNKATLEMVETEERTESNVTVGLLLEDGERRTAEFVPNTTLFELITSLAPSEFALLQNPTILYTRQEVTGVTALKEKTLRKLGLIGGRAVLRLLDKPELPTQANVSNVYRRQTVQKEEIQPSSKPEEPATTSERTNKSFDPVKLIKTEKQKQSEPKKTDDTLNDKEANLCNTKEEDHRPKGRKISNDREEVQPMEVDKSEPSGTTASSKYDTQAQLERRLKIEEEVTFIGAQKAIIFKQPDHIEDEIEDLPDDFYDLSLEEVRKIYHDLQQQRLELENAPLMTAAKKEELEKITSEQRLNVYKNVVVRIQFPDQIILQGVFSPNDKIEDVTNFVRGHLRDPNLLFHIFTTPFKETLHPKVTLIEAKYVPCVHMHFKWVNEDRGGPYLKEDLYLKQTSSDAACILASKYRAPHRRKMDEATTSSQRDNSGTTTSKSSKVPKWFKT